MLQSAVHHLDVFDPTLLVLAHVEALLEDPTEGLLHPAGLDRRVEQALSDQGIRLPPIPSPAAAPQGPTVADPQALRSHLAGYWSRVLTDEARLLLKWTALLHDVGKPGTRGVTQRGGQPKVQFLGHPDYGLELLELRAVYEFLGGTETWFLRRNRVSRLQKDS